MIVKSLKKVFLFFSLIASIQMNAQLSSTVVIPRDTIEVGDNITATIRLKKPVSLEVKGINLSSTINPKNPANPFASQDSTKVSEPADMEIISMGNWPLVQNTSIVENNKIKWQLDPTKQHHLSENNIEMVFWDPGIYVLEGVEFISRDSFPLNVLRLQPTLLTVLPPAIFMDTTQTQLELRPLKNIIYEDKNWKDYYVYYVILGALLLLGGIAFFLNRIKKEEAEEADIEVILPPAHELALDKLSLLDSEKLWQQEKIKEYQSRLTYIIREYLENRYDIAALEMTTSEITRSLRTKAFDFHYEGKLKNILMMADLVKFAKASPSKDIHQQFMDTAIQFVNDTKSVNPIMDEEE